MKNDKRVNLRALIASADKAAKAAKGEYQAAVVALRKELAYQVERRNIAKSADARDAIMVEIDKALLRLKKRLDRIMDAQASVASRTGYKAAASELDGLSVVRYSKDRATAICEAVAARNGEGMAATFTTAISKQIKSALRAATVQAFNEQAVAGMSQRELAQCIKSKWLASVKDADNLRFVDKGGRVWNTDNYLMMNVRTNSMAIYNDTLVDTITQTTGSDLVRISDDGGTADSCDACSKWAGRIVSVTGQTKGYPTLDEAKADGLFHPNCIHTIEYVDEDEIKKAKR